MNARLVQLLAVIRKEASQIGSDRRMVSMLVIMPTIMLLIFGNAVNFDVDHVPTAVVDHDGTAASREHLRRLLADGTLDRVAEVIDDKTAIAMLDSGEAAAVVVIPADFDRTRLRGETAIVQVVIDGTDPSRAGVASGPLPAISRPHRPRMAPPPGPFRRSRCRRASTTIRS
jgi:ABC-2 type transport system permease protein